MVEKRTILTPIGRLVAGDVFKGNSTDHEGRPLTVKSGPNAGQQRIEYYIGVAFEKTNAEFSRIQEAAAAQAKESFPTLFDANGNCTNPRFAWKIIDGDSQVPNSAGNKPCDKEGYPGHWIVNFASGFAPKAVTAGGEAVITDPEAIKRGYYVRVFATLNGNGSMQQPGIFFNHSIVELVGYGKEIMSGPDAKAVFGGTPVTGAPAGMSTTPLAPPTAPAANNAPFGGNPTAPAGMTPPTAPAAPAGMTPPTAPTAPAPAPDTSFVNNAAAVAPPAPPAPPAPAAPQMTAAAQGTYEQYKSAGWTDQQMKDAGLLA